MSSKCRVLVLSRARFFGWQDWANGVKEVKLCYPLAFLFGWRNIKLKYKQAVLGVAWAAAQPIALTVVFVLFTRRLGEPLGDDVPYKAFTMATLIGWTFFQTVVSLGSQGPLNDGGLMQRIYFPREFSVLGWCLASALDLGIVVLLFLVTSPLLGITIGWTFLFVVPLSMILLTLGTGIAFLMGSIMVYYRDIRYALPLLMQLWLFASPVAYPLVSIPEKWRIPYVILNPVAGVLDGFYRCLAAGVPPDPLYTSVSVFEGIFLLVTGYMFFKTLEPSFADVM